MVCVEAGRSHGKQASQQLAHLCERLARMGKEASGSSYHLAFWGAHAAGQAWSSCVP